MMDRTTTKQVFVGSVPVGGGAPVAIQSMTNTPTTDVSATLDQIHALHSAGCHIVRVSVYNTEAAEAFKKIRENTTVPLVADIHFDYRMALAAIAYGADKIRINPGNIGSKERVFAVVAAAKEAGIPIRVGVNAGSLQKDILKKHGGPTPQALVESAQEHIALLESAGFYDMVLSIKASDVPTTVAACTALSAQTSYAQHLGITEAGTPRFGTIKSSVGLGALLSRGIGDTIRVSLAGDPCEEIPVAKGILQSLGLASGPTVIACPTCGRTRINLVQLAEEVEAYITPIEKDITVAVMGCVVNGPGEAREADYGIAGGDGVGLIFKKGTVVKKVSEAALIPELIALIEQDQ
ncbi:flavodoxin-dependent (E)-4-hydroxy-3-methylbut-2-enyl-diphosphate synthase [Chitinivibrio alkaliphilus]|uniref:4-hydroxy-3-methylbut-2-en-1-yl diphosphate synthase (flavodoxin) n=1 Tax=Chitinivibrio alkaliphilus ACht1 TaxID=1313304 RepID=U7D8Y2_9BACT|nr:flavodoxin-dependent (E)-4-hydroxy-3-methylbut-2-enyl-diphosphate synthase [Chitinivibrio alkaliphilus]ERP31562.1 4-hydroxy-3-methylbut-2-en-1-yl diphosphate synthase [Chitinivibrio alkaliphilus ACht1]